MEQEENPREKKNNRYRPFVALIPEDKLVENFHNTDAGGFCPNATFMGISVFGDPEQDIPALSVSVELSDGHKSTVEITFRGGMFALQAGYDSVESAFFVTIKPTLVRFTTDGKLDIEKTLKENFVVNGRVYVRNVPAPNSVFESDIARKFYNDLNQEVCAKTADILNSAEFTQVSIHMFRESERNVDSVLNFHRKTVENHVLKTTLRS